MFLYGGKPVEIEYTLCQIQSGDISLAAKTHRQLQGDPKLNIQLSNKLVKWELINLVDGTPETITGVPRTNHVDFYFLYDNFKAIRHMFPNPTVNPDFSLVLPPVSSAGSEGCVP